MPDDAKICLKAQERPNLAIVSAYNDMLSAHQPLEAFPRWIKEAALAGRRHGAVRRRHPGHVRWRDPGPGRHGPVPVLARRDRHGHRRGAVPPDVRRRAVPGRLRQDRARAGDGRAVLRPPAGGVRAGRADDHRHRQRGEGPHPPALRRRQDRPRRTAGSRDPVLPRPRHLHFLRHRQFEPDADGDHGPAPARHRLHQPRHAAARGADAPIRPPTR